MSLRAGTTVYLGKAAGVPWTHRPIWLRLIRVEDIPADDGYVWLTGYALDARGRVVERRTALALLAGVETQ